jgi:hypothetical protein
LTSSLSSYLTTTTAASTYATISSLSSYVTNSSLTSSLSSYLTTATAASTYATISSLSSYVTNSSLTSSLSSYLTTATAASTYATISSLSSYLTTATAASTYVSNTYLTTNYNTKTDANALFLPFAGGRISGNSGGAVLTSITSKSTISSTRISTGVVELTLGTSYGSQNYIVVATPIQAATQITVAWEAIDNSTIRFHTERSNQYLPKLCFQFCYFLK